MLETCMPEFVLSQSKESQTDMDVFAPTGGGQFSKWFETGVNKLPFPPTLVGEKFSKIAYQGRIAIDFPFKAHWTKTTKVVRWFF